MAHTGLWVESSDVGPNQTVCIVDSNSAVSKVKHNKSSGHLFSLLYWFSLSELPRASQQGTGWKEVCGDGVVLARTELDRQCAMWLHLVTCNALIYWLNLINIELYSVSRYEILCISYQNLQVPDNFSLLTLTSVTSYEISRDDDPELVRLRDGGGHRAGAAGVSGVSAVP